MKIKRNRKADSSIWGIILAVAGMLIFAVIAIPFTGGVAAISTETIAKTQCKATLEAKNSVNQKIGEAADEARDVVGGAAGAVGIGGAMACSLAIGVGALFCGAGGYIATSAVGNAAVDSVENIVTIKTDTCIENFQDECPIVIGKKASADLAAECVYRRSVDTFYTLQGGRGKDFEKRTIEDRKFNLFKLNVTVEEPGSVLVGGSCSTYLTDTAIWTPAELQAANLKDCGAVVNGGRDYVCGSQQDANTCNITFSRVNEDTMTLAMVSKCQQEGSGPDKTGFCKCFANPDAGYSTFNGLPNTDISNKDTAKFRDFEGAGGATYTTSIDGLQHPEYSIYSGCGARSGLTSTKVGGATVIQDGIIANDLNVNIGDEKTYYLRLYPATVAGGVLPQTIGVVEVSANEQ